MGARPLKRALEEYVEDPLSEMLLNRPDQKWSTLIDLVEDKVVLREQKPAAEKVTP